MGRPPCCDESSVKKGPWTREEDQKLVAYIHTHGHGSWRLLPKRAGLNRCCKSCRLRWTNYLRPDIKRGNFSPEEEQTILALHSVLGNKWSTIATHLSGRTDNEIKNYWNTCLKKRLIGMGVDPITHRPRARTDVATALPQLVALASLTVDLLGPWNNFHALHAAQSEAAVAAAAQMQCLQSLLLQPTTTAATGAGPLDMNSPSFLNQAVASYAAAAATTPVVSSATSQSGQEMKQRPEPFGDHGTGTPVAMVHDGGDGCASLSLCDVNDSIYCLLA